MAEHVDARRSALDPPSPAGTEPGDAVEAAPRAVQGLPTGTPADPLGGSRPDADVVSALRRRRGRGQPLAADTAQRFGAQFGTDLAGVRLHADAEAGRMAESVGAAAFTFGSDVYFAPGQGGAGGGGDALLAHELAHVAQHRAGGTTGVTETVIGRADDPAEAEADRMAGSALSALRRHAVEAPTPDAGGSDPATLHRLTVAQLREGMAKLRPVRTSDADTADADTADADTADADTADGDTDTDTDTGTAADADTGTAADADIGTAADVDAGAAADVDAGADVVAEVAPEVAPGADVDAEVEPEIGPAADVDADVVPEIGPGPQADADVEAGVDEEPMPAQTGGAGAPAGWLDPDVLRWRVAEHFAAMVALRPALSRQAPAADREARRTAALTILREDRNIVTMLSLNYEDLYLFIDGRRLTLQDRVDAIEAERTQAAKDAAGAESEATDEAGAEGEEESGEEPEGEQGSTGAAQVRIDTGRLTHAGPDGSAELVDTAASTSPDGAEGWAAFTVAADFTIAMVVEADAEEPSEAEAAGVAELLSDEQALIVGIIGVHEGAIENLHNTGDPGSPSLDDFAEFLLFLDDQGVGLDFDVSGFDFSEDRTAAQILSAYLAALEPDSDTDADAPTPASAAEPVPAPA